MGFFNEYPYSNLHEVNLDYVLNKVKSLENVIKNFTSLNTLKYADPVEWDIANSYERNVIVVDTKSGNAYLSKQPVPRGISIYDTTYWLKIFDYKNNGIETIRFYVSNNGSDKNTGLSENDPVETLVKAYELCREYPNYVIHEIWVESGSYKGLQNWDLKQLSYVMRAKKGSVINITTDFAVRSGGHVLFGDWLWDGRDEAEWHFGGEGCINGIYCYGGASIVMNCPCYFDNCLNGLAVDDGGMFACQEISTEMHFGNNIRGWAIESTKSMCGCGIVSGGTVPIGYKSIGGFITVSKDNLKATKRYEITDGGYCGLVHGLDIPLSDKVYYVDSVNGSDENPGTIELPLSSITEALNICQWNNTGNHVKIIIKAGTYDGVIVEDRSVVFDFKGDCTLTKPIVCRHNAHVELLGGKILTFNCDNDNAVFVAESSRMQSGCVLNVVNAINGIFCGTGSVFNVTVSSDRYTINCTESAVKCEHATMFLGELEVNSKNGIVSDNSNVYIKTINGNTTNRLITVINGGLVRTSIFEVSLTYDGVGTNFMRCFVSNDICYLSGAIYGGSGEFTLSNLPVSAFNTNIVLTSTSGSNNLNCALDAGHTSITGTLSGDYVVNVSYPLQ